MLDTLEVVGSSSRWRILELLRGGPMDARSIAGSLGMTVQGAMKHLSVLADAGLVGGEGHGRQLYGLKCNVWLRREKEEGWEAIYFFRAPGGRPVPEAMEFRVRRYLRRAARCLLGGPRPRRPRRAAAPAGG
ncbi:MAG: winged helix-turn-helix transcriptional regulator [Nitrososphaerota archaeon]|nr:winged helix-turn-helix transcriptional regulator [Nitrososphaerota archaeon]